MSFPQIHRKLFQLIKETFQPFLKNISIKAKIEGEHHTCLTALSVFDLSFVMKFSAWPVTALINIYIKQQHSERGC